MMLEPRFTRDVSKLHTHAFGHKSLTWWGIVGFFLIEGTAFAMALASYFFLMNQEQGWPPPPIEPPDLLAGTLFTLVMLASEIPNTIVKRAAEKGRLRTVRTWLLVTLAFGAALIVLRGFEFASLDIWWYHNAYASIIWALLVLHAVHFGTDFVDTCVLTGLMWTRHGMEGRKFVDVSENSLYWRFVWLSWLPIYVVIYWVPRWV